MSCSFLKFFLCQLSLFSLLPLFLCFFSWADPKAGLSAQESKAESSSKSPPAKEKKESAEKRSAGSPKTLLDRLLKKVLEERAYESEEFRKRERDFRKVKG